MAILLSMGIIAFAPPLRVDRGAVPHAASPTMMAKSEALPFLEKPATLDGSMAGDVGFDPLFLSEAYSIKWMREAELKHGRICMLAFVGYVAVDCGIRAPGAPAGISSLAAHDYTVKTGHMLALLFTVGIFEALAYNAISEMMSGETDRAPGDYGFDPLGYSAGKDEATKADYALKEITHCRAAMIGFAGIVTQSALKGIGFPYF
mmetsp:Transcript_53427/g.88710  ORF Transcript_53427/g.88710 Transcript_53427/m.88710 type:complete len:205 (+) Transcript_53427:34-648(+)|eukprot:CAMPEP_0119313716 /NCGR_PEP_ID=MMETSP1333-20130426/30101_1 /TAXON_ID=418940 /ORGANISM="Scyphosphaera apsteinii, Strain RCC1455" /LENGTH=204 /DNA_ID=CAMNT_0007318627 /DNA_START=19 /DNA_END=633 /DNA_ORIENTATION=+